MIWCFVSPPGRGESWRATCLLCGPVFRHPPRQQLPALPLLRAGEARKPLRQLQETLCRIPLPTAERISKLSWRELWPSDGIFPKLQREFQLPEEFSMIAGGNFNNLRKFLWLQNIFQTYERFSDCKGNFCLHWRNFPQLQWDFQLSEGFSLKEEEISTNRGISSNCRGSFRRLNDFSDCRENFSCLRDFLQLQKKFQLSERFCSLAEKISLAKERYPAIPEGISSKFSPTEDRISIIWGIISDGRGNFNQLRDFPQLQGEFYLIEGLPLMADGILLAMERFSPTRERIWSLLGTHCGIIPLRISLVREGKRDSHQGLFWLLPQKVPLSRRIRSSFIISVQAYPPFICGKDFAVLSWIFCLNLYLNVVNTGETERWKCSWWRF